MRAWLERSFRNRIFLTVLLVALVPLLLCDVLMTQVMIFRSEHTLRTDAQEEMALLTAQRSKDNTSQVGACIVSRENKILSMGYNGMPTGCFDDDMPWEREGEPLKTKYMYVCHAELNAILNHASGTGSLKGARIYTTLFPCNECAKALIQSGISQVIYYEDKYADSDSVIASKRMFDMVGIRYTPYKRTGRGVELAL